MKCDKCTLCCKLLPIKALNKKTNILCKYCDNGCLVHNSIMPEECKKFECSYYQMNKVNINLRPDNCHVIFEKMSNNLFFGTLDPIYDLSNMVLKQVNYFNKDGFSVIINSLSYLIPKIYPIEGKSKEEVFSEYQKEIKNECPCI